MKLGAENKKKVAIAVVLLVIAGGLFLRTMNSSSPAPAAPSKAAAPGAVVPQGPARNAGARDPRTRYIAYRLQPTLDPVLRLDLLQDSEAVKYQGAGRNIFHEHLEEIPKPLAPGLKGGAVAVQPAGAPWKPPAPPAPPPINLKFYGWASQPGEPRAIFLAQGDAVFVAREGDIIARRYKVLRITPSTVEILDVLSNNKQSIPLQG
jgi:hypothetical protein